MMDSQMDAIAERIFDEMMTESIEFAWVYEDEDCEGLSLADKRTILNKLYKLRDEMAEDAWKYRELNK